MVAIIHIGLNHEEIARIAETTAGVTASGGLIIIGGDDSTGYDRGTFASEDTSWSLSDLEFRMRDYVPQPVYDFPLQFFNGIKATETMVLMARMYQPPKLRKSHRGAFRANRSMFAKSGYLPKRIRRIRK